MTVLLWMILPKDAGAQVTTPPPPPPPPDSAARDSAAADSARARIEAEQQARARRLADTIKVPTPRAEVPTVVSVGPARTWTRDPLWASGALTLGELVDRVPGVTTFRSGWIAAPEMAAYLGRFGRVRIYLDGIELDGLNARMAGLNDLSSIDLWQIEDATIEPGADEVKVHLRSWRVTSTTPVTRVDISTGDLQTNVFRGFYGRRFPTGHSLQLGGQRYSTVDRRTSEEGDQTSFWGRVGWASGRWGVDASMLQSGRKYTAPIADPGPGDTIPTLDGSSITAIARLSWGTPSEGPWAQLIASAQSFQVRNPPLMVIDSVEGPGGGGPNGSPDEPDTLSVSADTTLRRPQYVLTGGWTRGPLSISAAGRMRRAGSENLFSPSVRAGYSAGRLLASAFVEQGGHDSTRRVEASLRVALPAAFAASASIGQASRISGAGGPATMAMRAELGRQLGRMWVTGGMMTRDTTELPAAVAFDTTFRGASQGAVTGYFATIDGKFWRDVGLDVTAVRFGSDGVFLPQYEVRSRLFLDSEMRNKFPSGNLHVRLGVTHEYRTRAIFPTSTDALRSSQYRTWGADLEVRLLTATITFQYRNFLGERFEQVPGYMMPSITSFYGIRWNFVN